MAINDVITVIGGIDRSVVGTEHPVAYRLARRNGELVLQGLWREIEWEYGRPMQADEWRDIPIAEVGGDG